MLRLFKDIFSGESAPDALVSSHTRVQIATCVILLEIAFSDDEFTEDERAHVIRTMRERFSLTEDEALELIAAAESERKAGLDVWQFTHEINRACTVEEKTEILEEVWRVIYADGGLDGHEDYMARKLATLLNVKHHLHMEAKMKVLRELRGG